jgi:hypothetical protein
VEEERESNPKTQSPQHFPCFVRWSMLGDWNRGEDVVARRAYWLRSCGREQRNLTVPATPPGIDGRGLPNGAASASSPSGGVAEFVIRPEPPPLV